MRKKSIISLAILLILSMVNISHAEIPEQISFQGRLSDTQGVPLTGSYNFTFRIYDQESGGVAIWTENQNGVSVTDGIYNVYLGSVTALDSLDFDTDYWVSIEVNADGEMTPRRRLSTASYAFRAKFADTASAITDGSTVAGSLYVQDTVTASSFVGDGSGLFNVLKSGVEDTMAANLNVSGTVTATGFSGSGFGLTDLITNLTIYDTTTKDSNTIYQNNSNRWRIILTTFKLGPVTWDTCYVEGLIGPASPPLELQGSAMVHVPGNAEWVGIRTQIILFVPPYYYYEMKIPPDSYQKIYLLSWWEIQM